jgi:uncharacterized repeat protein (TIGR02543 family)
MKTFLLHLEKSTSFMSRAWQLTLLVLLFSGGVFGQSPATYNFVATSGSIDANISFSTAQNGAALPAIIGGNQLRMYSVRASGNGNSLFLTPSNGAIITQISIVKPTGGDSPALNYFVDGGSAVAQSSTASPIVISSLNVTSSLEIKNVHSGGSSNLQLRLSSITVTYTMPVSGKTVTFDANGGTGTMTPQTASSSTALTANGFSRTGYTFSGWNTVALGGGTAYANNASYPFTADATLYAQWTASGKTSISSGDWNTAGTWSPSGVPTAGDNVTIASGHTVFTATPLTRTGTTTVNGSFQINQGGFAGGAGTWTYGSGATLIYNHTAGTYGPLDSFHTYWPSTDGPTNVTIANSSSGGIDLGLSRTVAGTFQTSAGVTLTSATLTLNGIARLNTGGFFNNAPTYGSASTLVYNGGAAFGRGNEWTTATSGAGYPANVQISNPGTVTTLNMGSSSAQNSGNLTIDASTILNTTSSSLTVLGNVLNNGTMALNGDVNARGNWTLAASATQTNNTKAVFFNAATGNQTITRTGGGTVNFDYLLVDKAAGNVVLSSSPATNVAINTTAGDVLQILNTGNLDLNGQTLTLNNDGGNIAVNAAGRTITSGVSGAKLIINGNKSVTGSGALIIGANVSTELNKGLDFGSSKTTINGTLQINAGGFANNNSPIYSNSSTLIYNNVTYNVGFEWTGNATSAGLGTPQNVTLTTSTVTMPGIVRSLAGNLSIGTGSTLNLSTTANADLNIGGNWNKVGTFNPNNKAVFFRGTTAQTITGATTFDYLTINNTAGVTLANSIINNLTLDFANGKLTLGVNDLTIGSGGTITGMTAAKYVVTNSTGQLKRTVGSSDILFAVGNTSYNPITFNNSGTSDIYGVKVQDGAITTALVNTKTVSRRWLVSEATVGGSNLKVIAQYNASDENTNFNAGTTPKIGFYNGTNWIEVLATQVGTNPFTFTSNSNISPSTLAGTQYFALGKDNAFLSPPATKLAFVNVPSTGTVGVNLNTFTVEARGSIGSNDFVDINYTGVVTIAKASGSGTLSGTLTVAAVAGVATFSDAQFNAADTYTIAATAAGLTSDTSGNIVVTAFPYVNGDVRPLDDFNDLSYGGTSPYRWSELISGVWTNRSASPQSSKPSRLIIDKTVGGGANVTNTYNDIVVTGNGVLNLDNTAGTLQDFIATGKKLEIQNGGEVILNGQIKMNSNANLIVKNNGTLTLNSYSIDNSHPLWQGKENFEDGSTVNITNWNWVANNTDRPLLNSTSQILDNVGGYKFGNLIIDAALGDDWTLVPGSGYSGLKLCQNNLEVSNSSAIYFLTGTSNNSSGFTINGDFIIYDGWFNFGTTFGGSTNFANNYIINGDFINLSDDDLKLHYRVSGTGTASGDITVLGDFTIDASVTQITNQFTKRFILKGGSAASPKILDVAIANVLYVPFVIEDGYRVLKSDLSLGTNSSMLVKSGATLDFGFATDDTALNVLTNAAQLNMTFTNESGSTLKITSPDGITTSSLGNVQTPVAGRTFNAAGIYHYVGKSETPQVTGDAIATAANPLTGRIIVDMESFAGEFSASDNRTINTPGTLEIKTGIVTDNSVNSFIGTGNVLMNSVNGRYITSKTGTQPSLQGTYTLTAGLIDFANNSATASEIRATPDYFDVQISGSSVKPGGKRFIIDNILNIKSGGILTVPATDDSATPYVVTASKGIQVAAGGKALFGNNANLMQDVSVTNIGNISVDRIAKLPNNGYNYWSAPVAGQALRGNTFSPGTPDNRIFRYNEPNDRFIATTDNNFVVGQAYAIKGGTADDGINPRTFNFIGTPNNGSISTPPLTKKDIDHGYNLIGNPYPSNLDFNLFHAANSGVMFSTAYFWTNNTIVPSQQGSSYSGANYAILNGTGGNPAAYQGTSAGPTPTASIKPGQGFIIQMISASSLSFNNSMRNPLGSVFFNNKNTSEKDRFHLSLTTPSNINNILLVGYVNGASNSFEQDFDTELLINGSDSFYTKLGLSRLAIQGRTFPLIDSDIVPLGAVYFESGIHKISIFEKEGIFQSTQNIYLKDKLLGKIANLTAGDYEFSAIKGTDENRFEIIYKPETVLATDETKKNNLQVYRAGEEYVIKSQKGIIQIVEVYDFAGRLITQVKGTSNEVRIKANSLSSAVYILKIKRDGEIISKKIVH